MRVRNALLIGVAAVVATSTAACGGSSSNSSSGGTATSSQVLHVAVDSLPAAKGNPFSSTGAPGIYTLAAIYDPLTFVDKDGSVKPWLATSWKNTTATTWTFTLRQGVKFSNGETLDASGVADVISYMKSNADLSKTPVAGDLSNIASAKATDATTVEITTTTPDPILPNKLTELYLPAPKVLTGQGIQAITDNPVGTGPFAVKNWGANSVTLDAYRGSWRAPKVGGLQIQALSDPAARLQALQSNQVDLITGVSPDQSKQLTGNLKADVTKVAQVMSLAFINTKGNTPLADQKVRQALNYAVDKKAMADKLLLGKGSPTGQGTSPNAAGYNPGISAYPQDISKAKQLLTEAGYPNGFNLSADVVVGSFPADADIYQLMKDDLSKVGVNVTLQQVTFSDWLKKYVSNNWDAQSFGLSWNSLPTMDGGRAMSLFSCLKQPAFFCDQPTSSVLSQALSNLDLKARDRQLQQVGQNMYDNPPALYLVQQVDIIGLSSSLHGFDDNNRFFPYDRMTKG